MQVEPFFLRSWTTFLFVRFTVASLVTVATTRSIIFPVSTSFSAWPLLSSPIAKACETSKCVCAATHRSSTTWESERVSHGAR